MCGVIVVELRLAVQQHAARPVEVVLVEVVRARLVLSRALIVLERIRLVLLPEDMDLKFGAAFQPTLKRLCEMTLRHVETGGRRRRPAASTSAASPALVTAVLQEAGSGGEVGLDGHEGDHRRRRRDRKSVV